jgi:hypothetical protein
VHGFVDSPAAANGNARVVLRRQEFLTQKILKRRNGDTENRRELDLVATWTETARRRPVAGVIVGAQPGRS